MREGQPSPGADVAALSPVPAQMWQRRSLRPSAAVGPRRPSVPTTRTGTRFVAQCYGYGVGQQRRRGHWLARSIDQLRCRLRMAHLRLVIRQRVIAARETGTRDLTPTAQPIQAAADSGS
jgi:hypothetical protein